MANRIHALGTYRQEEIKAGEAGIYPGMLLKMNSSGEVIKHSTEGGAQGDEVLVASEDALQGRDVTTVYADDSIVTVLIPNKGSVLRMRWDGGTAVGIGDIMHSTGSGELQEASAAASAGVINAVVGIAMEAIDMSDSAGVASQLGLTRIV